MSQQANRDVTLHQLLISNTSQLEQEARRAADAPSRQKSQLTHCRTNGVSASSRRLYTSNQEVQMFLNIDPAEHVPEHLKERLILLEKMIFEHVTKREKPDRLLLSHNIMMT